jgi:hypothetical protein
MPSCGTVQTQRIFLVQSRDFPSYLSLLLYQGDLILAAPLESPMPLVRVTQLLYNDHALSNSTLSYKVRALPQEISSLHAQ